jgi:hypothetical protein
MKIEKCLTTDPLFVAALSVIPCILAFAPTHAKELPLRNSRHIWSALYFKTPQAPDKDDWYEPTRSPGWHEEAGN